MVRSHALYPIELRAHRGRIACLNYNGTESFRPTPIRPIHSTQALDRDLIRVGCSGLDYAVRSCQIPCWLWKSAALPKYRRPLRHGRFSLERKSFRPQRKTYPPECSPPACCQSVSDGTRHAFLLARRSGAQRGILENTSARGLSECPFAFAPLVDQGALRPASPALPRESS